MAGFEYKVVPAPKRGKRARGVKGTEERFAHALMELMNELGREGWEYQRSDTLPVETRSALRGKSTEFQNVLVFRRAREAERTEPFRTTEAMAVPAADAPQGPSLSAASREPGEGSAPALGPASAPEGEKPAPGVAAE